MSFPRWKVFELREGQPERRVWSGPVDPDILKGEATLQARPFGRCYHINGQVFRSDDDRRILSGVTCRFEAVK